MGGHVPMHQSLEVVMGSLYRVHQVSGSVLALLLEGPKQLISFCVRVGSKAMCMGDPDSSCRQHFFGNDLKADSTTALVDHGQEQQDTKPSTLITIYFWSDR